MNDSYAVKPELYDLNENPIELTYIEEIISFQREQEFLRLKTNLNDLLIGFYDQGIIRIMTAPKPFKIERSFSLEQIEPLTTYSIHETDETIELSLNDLTVFIDKNPFNLRIEKSGTVKFLQRAIGFLDEKTYLIMDRHLDDFVYGLGEKTGFLNKNNEKTSNWNSDIFDPHTRSVKELYQSIHMFIHRKNENTYGMFIDNPSRVTFDFDTYLDQALVITDRGTLDYYIYTGDKIKDIVVQNATLTGKTYLPPLWALGYHQSRHSYGSTKELLEIYRNFKERQIPVDTIYLDILYMERYKVFSFNQETYQDVEEVIQQLKADGVRIVPIVDPGVKVEEGYSIYEEGVKKDFFCKYPDGRIFTGEVWPGQSAFYDFLNSRAREHWGDVHKFYTDLGIEGIWNDMNEPSVFNSPSKTLDLNVLHDVDGTVKTHEEVHNLYGLGMSAGTYEGLKRLINKRPFVLTRAGYAGIQKVATVWTGDNRSSWEHLEMALPMCLNLSLSGITLSGTDIGGFMDDTTEELLIRWTQLGVFMPYFRNHSSIGLKYQEPWRFGERCENITKRYIELRYELIRYIYSEIYKSHQTGIPLMRPLVFDYENDSETLSMHDEFLFGSNLLVAPILRPGETVRKVYLPEGDWFDFFTGERFEGGRFILVRATLEEIPVFVRGGSVLPLSKAAMNTEKLDREITLKVYPNGGSFSENFFFDDGISLDGEALIVTVQVNDSQVEVIETGNKDLGFTFKVEIIK